MSKFWNGLTIFFVIVACVGSLLAIIFFLPKVVEILKNRRFIYQGSNYQKEVDVIFVTKTQPHKLVYLNYVSNTANTQGKAFYYDNNKWATTAIDDTTHIALTNQAADKSATNINVASTITVDGHIINLTAENIPLTMPIKATDKFMKFGGSTSYIDPNTLINIDGKDYEGVAAILLGHNFEAGYPELGNLGITTYWLVYWDKNWNFYHLDKTTVENPVANYKAHLFFGEQTKNSATYFKNFNVNLNEKKDLTVTYTDNGLSKTLLLNLGGQFNSWGDKYRNFGSIITGEGVGIFQYLDTSHTN